jgi:hypothetical protein
MNLPSLARNSLQVRAPEASASEAEARARAVGILGTASPWGIHITTQPTPGSGYEPQQIVIYKVRMLKREEPLILVGRDLIRAGRAGGRLVQIRNGRTAEIFNALLGPATSDLALLRGASTRFIKDTLKAVSEDLKRNPSRYTVFW